MKTRDQDPHASKIADGLLELLKFVSLHPKLRDQGARQRMTFNEFFAELRSCEKELGVEPDRVAPFRDDPEVQRLELELSMEMDTLGLVEDEQHWDLPINFRSMPEYEPMLEAEDAWIEQNDGYVRDEDLPALREIVRQHAPDRTG